MKRPFTAGERKGLLVLLPLLAVIGVVAWVGKRPAADKSLDRLADARMESRDERVGEIDDRQGEAEVAAELFTFDPNTIDLRGLCRLGFAKKEAAGIISYRNGGKVFRDPYDFAGCYQVSIEMFERLEPYIVIGAKYRRPVRESSDYALDQRRARVERDDSLFVFDPNDLDSAGYVSLGFSPRQSAAILNYRTMRGGFRTEEDFAACYQVSPEKFEALRPYIAMKAPEPPAKVDINRADSAALCSVNGIGPVTATRILEYRRRLGGFVSVAQLAEVAGVTQQNYDLFSRQIIASSYGISKIDINFAPPEQLQHPYMSGAALRKLLKNRQLKGGWSTIEDMVKDDILSTEQAARLAPYLVFRSGD